MERALFRIAVDNDGPIYTGLGRADRTDTPWVALDRMVGNEHPLTVREHGEGDCPTLGRADLCGHLVLTIDQQACRAGLPVPVWIRTCPMGTADDGVDMK